MMWLDRRRADVNRRGAASTLGAATTSEAAAAAAAAAGRAAASGSKAVSRVGSLTALRADGMDASYAEDARRADEIRALWPADDRRVLRSSSADTAASLNSAPSTLVTSGDTTGTDENWSGAATGGACAGAVLLASLSPAPAAAAATSAAASASLTAAARAAPAEPEADNAGAAVGWEGGALVGELCCGTARWDAGGCSRGVKLLEDVRRRRGGVWSAAPGTTAGAGAPCTAGGAASTELDDECAASLAGGMAAGTGSRRARARRPSSATVPAEDVGGAAQGCSRPSRCAVSVTAAGATAGASSAQGGDGLRRFSATASARSASKVNVATLCAGL